MFPDKNATPTAQSGVRLPDRLSALAAKPRERIRLPEPRACPTRFLSPVERATVQVTFDSDHTFPNNVLGEAAIRLWILELRGLLPHLSGHYVAQSLQYVFYGSHPSGHRLARRGWVMLGALDAADIGVEVWISAEPTDDAPRHFRRMRMHTRLAELSDGSERRQRSPR
ncbi:hypothetical protein ACIRCZ_03140 [Leifsonia sp. NPDC102414]|uniref:hypothetical protein n=1 Tax=Leifsonia sp. NPDC102414 TaxID=3364124 RepID=UPI003821DAE4